jgi:hypothetical protein
MKIAENQHKVLTVLHQLSYRKADEKLIMLITIAYKKLYLLTGAIQHSLSKATATSWEQPDESQTTELSKPAIYNYKINKNGKVNSPGVEAP